MNSSMVDWDLAVTTGRRLVSPGPHGHRRRGARGRRQLRAFAAEAHGHVAGFTRLDAPTDGGAAVVVIDRPGWIQANAAGFRTVLEPLIEKIQQQRQHGRRRSPTPSARR